MPKLIQETNRLFRLTHFGMINCFLVKEDDGLTLVDTGLTGTTASIIKAAKRLGSQILRIVLTHAHIDHVGSLDSLVHHFPGIDFAVGQRESRLLQRDFSLDAGESGRRLLGFPSVNRARPAFSTMVNKLALFRPSFLRVIHLATWRISMSGTVRS